MYQNKAEEQVVTPAHLLLIPLDSGSVANFTNFKSVGLDTLQASSAFGKIRNATKIYNSHLVHTPSSLTQKYLGLQELFVNENNLLSTSSFGLRRQHALTSVSSLGNSHASTLLDSKSFDKFLASNFSLNEAPIFEALYSPTSATPLSLQKNNNSEFDSSDSTRLLSLVGNNPLRSSPEGKSILYPTSLNHVNDDSDKSGLEFPSTKVASDLLTLGDFSNKNFSYGVAELDSFSSNSTNSMDLTRSNFSTSSKEYNLSGPNSKVLLSDQSIRAYPNLTPSHANYNLSSSVNTVESNKSVFSRLNQNSSPLSSASDSLSQYVDSQQLNKLASSRSFISESHSPVLSSDRRLNNSLDFDTTSSVTQKTAYSSSGSLESSTVVSSGSVGDVFVGSREKTPRSINTAY